MEKKNLLKELNSYFFIVLGLFIYTVSWAIFIIPNRIVGGGISGVSAVIEYTTNFPISYSYFLINLGLLAVALKLLGKSFGAKTVFAVVVASVFFKIHPMWVPPEFIKELSLANGKLLSTIIGGAGSGLGVALTISHGGSTGGTDIIALIINKYRSISPGRVILLCDIFIIASSLLVPYDGGIGERIANIVYGYILVLACSYTIDLYLNGLNQSVQIFIFSKRQKEIAERISAEVRRGVTILNGTGWYSKEDIKILMVVVKKNEQNLMFNIVKNVDSDAFMSVGSVRGVYGKGFDTIKKGSKK